MTYTEGGMPDLKYSEETFREMYEALKELAFFLSHDGYDTNSQLAPIIDRAAQALAKAEGTK